MKELKFKVGDIVLDDFGEERVIWAVLGSTYYYVSLLGTKPEKTYFLNPFNSARKNKFMEQKYKKIGSVPDIDVFVGSVSMAQAEISAVCELHSKAITRTIIKQ